MLHGYVTINAWSLLHGWFCLLVARFLVRCCPTANGRFGDYCCVCALVCCALLCEVGDPRWGLRWGYLRATPAYIVLMCVLPYCYGNSALLMLSSHIVTCI